MKIVANAPSPADELRELADLLEGGEPIPSGLAKSCSRYLITALDSDSKIPTGVRPGRPRAYFSQLDRATRVAALMRRKILRDDAIRIVAKQTGRKNSTVEKDYKNHGKLARTLAKTNAAFAEWVVAFDELKTQLATFRHDDGSNYSDLEVSDILSRISPPRVRTYLRRIENGPVRRGAEFLEKVLAD